MDLFQDEDKENLDKEIRRGRRRKTDDSDPESQIERDVLKRQKSLFFGQIPKIFGQIPF
jgi:hypothetical protein